MKTSQMTFLFVVMTSSLSHAESDALRWERLAKTSRAAIQSGHARIDVVNTVRNVPSENGLVEIEAKKGERRDSYELWFEGDKLRVNQNGVTHVLNSESYLLHGTDNQGQNLGVSVMPRADGVTRVADLRVWGVKCGPFSIISNFLLDDVLERADRLSDDVREEVVEGDLSLTVVSIEHKSGAKMSYWIDSARANSIVRAMVEGDAPRGAGKMEDRIDCKLKQFNGVWFPEQVVFQRSLDGVLLFDEVSTATNITLNEDLPDDVFTIAAMNLPQGTFLHEKPMPVDGPRIWDGEKVSTERAGVPVPEQNTPSRRMTVLIIANVVIGFILVGIFFYLRRHVPSSG